MNRCKYLGIVAGVVGLSGVAAGARALQGVETTAEKIDAQEWEFAKKLKALDPQNLDSFGSAVALDGDTLVVGAWRNDDACPTNPQCDSGAAYLFERDAAGPDNWGLVAKIIALDDAAGDGFGQSVAVHGGVVAIGAPGDDSACSDNPGCNSGAVYLFEKGPTWRQVAKITASDGEAGDALGVSVAIDGDRMILGASGDDDRADGSGAAYIFERGAEGWSEVAKITATDGQRLDAFGSKVGLSGSTVVVAAPRADDACPGQLFCDSGAAYLYERSPGVNGSWDEVVKFRGGQSDHFGTSVAISGDTVVVGSPLDDVPGIVDAGRIYIFERHHSGWNAWGLVKSATGVQVRENFGATASVRGDLMAIGSPVSAAGNFTSYASILERSFGNWGLVLRGVAPDYDPNHLRGVGFGTAFGISGETVAIGAIWDANSGAVYLYEGTRPPVSCAAAPSDLVSWWKGDGAAVDRSGPHDGIPHNGLGFAPGWVGHAFHLDGVDDYVEVVDSEALTPTDTGFTVMAWVRFDSFQTSESTAGPQTRAYVAEKGPVAPALGWEWFLGAFSFSGGVPTWQFGVATPEGVRSAAISSLQAIPNAWRHVAGTLEPDGTLRLYSDGALVATGTTAVLPIDGDEPLKIGQGSGSGVEWFTDGLIDELTLYDRALSAAEIAAIYDADLAGLCFDNTSPTADAGPDQTLVCDCPEGRAVSLDGTGSWDPEGDALSYLWTAAGEIEFDDPNQAMPSADFPVGTTVVTLVVNDGAVSSTPDTVEITIVATPGDNTPPVAVAGTSLDGNGDLLLDGAASSDSDGDALSFSWQIASESGTRTGEQVSITDLGLGTHAVTLTVHDGQDSAVDTLSVGIVERCPSPPADLQADFSADTSAGAVPLSVQFMDRSSAQNTSITSWQWDLDGDGVVDSTDQDPLAIYTATGSYSVALTVSDGAVSDTVAKTAFVIVFDHAEGLVGYWPLDQEDGSQAGDLSGHGGHGTLVGEPVWSTAGVVAGALALDGSGDFVEVADPGAGWILDRTEALTLALWVNPGSLGGTQELLSKDGAFEFEIGQAGSDRYSLRLDNLRVGTGNSRVQADTWQHLAVTWDGADVIYYYNGVRDGSAVFAGPLAANDHAIGLGARPSPASSGGPVFFLDGILDDVRLYDRALSPAEIIDLLETAAAVDTTSGPVGGWSFDEGSGCTASDSTGSNEAMLGPTCPANAPVWGTGRVGTGLLFDGDDAVVIAASESLDAPRTLTLSAWIRHPALGQYRAILDKRDAGTDGYDLYIAPDHKLFFRVGDATLRSARDVADDSWHHVVGVYDGSHLRLYVDGVPETQVEVGLKTIDTLGDLYLGRHYAAPDFPWEGYLDEVRVYSRALSALEVALLYARAAGASPP